MRRGRFKGTVYVTATTEIGSHRLELSVSAYHDPGRTSGPPEDCYPPESELEILSARLIHKSRKTGRERERKLTAEIVDKLSDNDSFMDDVWEAVSDASREEDY